MLRPVPRHIGIIMDGNGRWARSKGFERVKGHSKGSTAVENVVTRCREHGVSYLTLYAFSVENWKRPRHEVAILMRLLKKFLVSERSLLMDKNVKLETIGDIDRLPKDVIKTLDDTKELTLHNNAMTLVLALSYGGREELVQAIKKITQNAMDHKITIDQIDDEMVSENLFTKNFPDPDLIIRTSGEFRTSNFLPWQSIYAEWYITPVYWPDFTPKDLDEAILAYQNRERRFGMTSDQIQSAARGHR